MRFDADYSWYRNKEQNGAFKPINSVATLSQNYRWFVPLEPLATYRWGYQNSHCQLPYPLFYSILYFSTFF